MAIKDINLDLTEDRRDTLQELINVAMGQAGACLASHMETFIDLSVPVISMVNRDQLVADMSEEATLEPSQELVSAIRQGFYEGSNPKGIRGEAIAVFGDRCYLRLAELLHVDTPPSPQLERELLLEATNTLTSSCMNGIADQLEVELDYSAPSMLGQQVHGYNLLDFDKIEWDFCLRIQVHYSESGGFMCNLFLLLTNPALAQLFRLTDKLLEDLEGDFQ